MTAFYGWVRNMVCYMCILNIFLQILPGGNFRKYVRFFGGLILVVIVVSPLADLVKASDTFEKAWRLEGLKEEIDEMEITSKGMEELRSQKINEAYRVEIQRQIEGVVKAYGLNPEKTTLDFETNEEDILTIGQVDLVVSKVQERMDVSEEEGGVTPEKIQEIKNELKEVYHISSEHINISIQE